MRSFHPSHRASSSGGGPRSTRQRHSSGGGSATGLPANVRALGSMQRPTRSVSGDTGRAAQVCGLETFTCKPLLVII